MKTIILSLALLPTLCFSMVGLKVNDKSPIKKLTTIENVEISLEKNKTPAVLVFYRGSWCPYCIKQLKSIETDIQTLSSKKFDLIAISVDRLKVAKKMKRNNNFSFHIVSDPKAKLLKSFNIINKLDDKLVAKYKSSYKIDVEGDSGEKHHMVAHPAVFIIKDGVITFADIEVDYKKRTSNKEIIKNL